MATKKEQPVEEIVEEIELTVDEHNAVIDKAVGKLKDEIKELQFGYKSESEKKQATLHECNMMSRGSPKD